MEEQLEEQQAPTIQRPRPASTSGRRAPWLRPANPFRLSLEVRPGRESAVRRDAIFRRSLVLADVVAAALALRLFTSADGTASALWGIPLGLLLTVALSKLIGLYDRDDLVFRKSTLDEAPALFQLAALFALLSWLLHGTVLTGPADRTHTVAVAAAFFLVALVGRTLARHVARGVSPTERCIIIGPSGPRLGFAAKLARSQRGTEVAGYLPLEDERREWGLTTRADRRRRARTLSDLERTVEELDAHRVVIIPGDASGDKMLEAVSRAKAAGVKVSILPRMFEVVGSSVEFDELEGVTVLGLRRFGLNRSSRFIKRSLDLVLAGAGLVLFAPVFLVAALAIKFGSPGPILFRQQRVGRRGDVFPMLKFRSMFDGADAEREALEHLNESEGVFKIADDPRITPVGRLLRRTSLDELPQLINVLRGEMSLVGPRPLVPDEDRRVEGHHRGRLDLTPGVTGPWQLLGPTRVPLDDMVNMDYLYGANWSLWADMKILLRTVAHVTRQRGV